MGYSKKAFEGFGWHSLMRFSASGLTLIKMMFLARLLTVNDFGLFSITIIALGLMEAMTETGINTIILRSPQKVEYFLDTAWIISIGRGLIIAIIMLLLSLGLTKLYGEPELLWLIGLASCIPVIKGFINPAIISYYKNLAFFQDMLYRLSLVIVEAAVAISLAVLFRSVYILIWSILIAAVYEVIFSFVVVKAKPNFKWHGHRAKEILTSSTALNLAAWLDYLVENIDNLLIGKLAGTTQLGYYDNSYKLSHKPNYDIARSVYHSTFPVFSRLQGETKRHPRAFTRVILSSTLLFSFASLPLLLAPELMVKLILGQQWLSIVPLIRWLTLAGIVHGLGKVAYSYLSALGQFGKINQHLAVTLLATVGLVWWWGSDGNVMGAVIAIFAARVLASPWVIWPIYRSLHETKSK